MSVTITGDAPHKEALAYADYLERKYNRKLKTLDIQSALRVMEGRMLFHMV